jgi:hypothetical protein
VTVEVSDALPSAAPVDTHRLRQEHPTAELVECNGGSAAPLRLVICRSMFSSTLAQGSISELASAASVDAFANTASFADSAVCRARADAGAPETGGSVGGVELLLQLQTVGHDASVTEIVEPDPASIRCSYPLRVLASARQVPPIGRR